jgi:dTDP-4-amino-4,6-dideoxygalactose transaminase
MTESSHRRLAIDGGRPAFPKGPPGWPLQDDAVREALAAAFAAGHWGRYDGPYVAELAERLASLHAVSHVHLCSSGTIAVELALRGLKVGEGDEVILAAYDFPGNFRCIEAVGARPVLVDLAPGGWTIDAAAIEAALSPQTRAVIVSHLHGSQADMRKIRELADRRGLAVPAARCRESRPEPGAMWVC